MASKRERLLEALADATATHASAILTEDPTRRHLAVLSYISFLQNLVMSLIADTSDTDKD